MRIAVLLAIMLAYVSLSSCSRTDADNIDMAYSDSLVGKSSAAADLRAGVDSLWVVEIRDRPLRSRSIEELRIGRIVRRESGEALNTWLDPLGKYDEPRRECTKCESDTAYHVVFVDGDAKRSGVVILCFVTERRDYVLMRPYGGSAFMCTEQLSAVLGAAAASRQP